MVINEKSTDIEDNSGVVTFYVGKDIPFNVQMTMQNIGRILADDFSPHLVTTHSDIPEDIYSYFEVFGQSHDNTLRGGYKALDEYLAGQDPIALTHVIRPPVSGCIAALLANKHGIPFLYRHSGDTFREHNLFNGLQRARLYFIKNIIGRLPLRLASRYIALGPAGKCQLMYRGVSSELIHILPTPVDPNRFANPSEPRRHDIPANVPMVLFVGRKSRIKGIKTLDRVIPKVLDRRKEMIFVLVGDGDGLELPERLRDRVYEVGPVSPQTIPWYFKRADMLVHPSLTESFGRVLVEALAAETPVVARAIGEMPMITSNTFVTDQELIEIICDYESLYLNDAERFAPENLEKLYIRFFKQLS